MCLHPVDWIDQAQNDNNKTDIKCLLEDCFDDVLDYIYDTYERFLLMFWENERINYSLFTNEQLSEPNESIQYTLEHLAYQKTTINQEVPFIIDKQLLRVQGYDLKNVLEPQPAQILQKIYLSLS